MIAQGQPRFIRGDADGNGTHEITDAVRILGYLFLGNPAVLDCAAALDVDASRRIEITDAISLLGFLFLGDSPPAPPFPGCGEDPAGDGLDCASFPPCPRNGDLPPTADAGDDKSVFVGETVELEGTGSRDPEGAPLAFSWTIASAPEGSRAALQLAFESKAKLRPDVAGEFIVELVVADGQLTSAPDPVVVTASLRSDAPDTDENGLPDDVERGPNPDFPLDTDGDQRFDFRDRDDDGDGVLDILDDDRLSPAPSSDPFVATGGPQLSGVSGQYGAETVRGWVRAGDDLVLDGRGFAAMAADNLVLFRGASDPINVRPHQKNGDALLVRVPDGARGPVAVVALGLRSNDLNLTIAARGSPVLLRMDGRSGRAGDVVVLGGLELDGAEVAFGVKSAAPTPRGEDLEVVVPSDVVSGDVTAINAAGPSNPLYFRYTTEVLVRLLLPAGLGLGAPGVQVAAGFEPAQTPSPDGILRVDINRAAADLLAASLPSGTPVLLALSLPLDQEVVVDALSTAVALVLETYQVTFSPYVEAIAQARSEIEELEQVIALARAIEDGLTRSTEILIAPDAALRSALVDAVRASAAAVGRAEGGVFGALAPAAAADEGPKADILPAAEQYDILVEQIAGSGNLRLENDTILSLSVQIDESSRIRQRHIRGPLDPDVIGSQSGLLQAFNASSVDFSYPDYRNARVEVITPGFFFPRPIGKPAVNAATFLLFRTVLEGIVWPIVSSALGDVTGKAVSKGKLPEVLATVLTALFDAYPSLRDGLRDSIETGEGPSAVSLILETIKFDLLNQSVLTTKAVSALLGDGAVAGAVLQNLTKKLLPGLNAADAVLKAVDLADTGTAVGKTIVDLATTPGRVEFEAVFPGVSVTTLTTSNGGPWFSAIPEPVIVDLRGYNFRVREDGAVPAVRFIDRGGGAYPQVDTNAHRDLVRISQAQEDGRRLFVTIEGLYAESAVGPIEVQVVRAEELAIAPEDLEVRSELAIESITPSFGVPGITVDVAGGRFFPEARPRIYFEEEDPDVPAAPRVFSVAPSLAEFDPFRLRGAVPELPEEKRSWRVYVEQGPVTRRIRSNVLTFVRTTPDAPGVPGALKWKVAATLITGSARQPPPLALGRDGTVYVGSLDQVLAFRPDGMRRQEFVVPRNVLGAVQRISIAQGGTIFAGGALHALDPSSGAVLWESDVAAPVLVEERGNPITAAFELDGRSGAVLREFFDATERARLQPLAEAIASNGVLYFLPGLRAVGRTGGLRWEDERELRRFSVGPDGTIYATINVVGGTTGLLAFTPGGEEKWFLPSGAMVHPPAVGEDGMLYCSIYEPAVPDPGGGTRVPTYVDHVAIDPVRASIVWFQRVANTYFTTISGPAVGRDNTVYFTAFYEKESMSSVVAYRGSNGAHLWTAYMQGTRPTSPAIAVDCTVYVATELGLYAFYSSSPGLAESSWPRERCDNQNSSRAR